MWTENDIIQRLRSGDDTVHILSADEANEIAATFEELRRERDEWRGIYAAEREKVARLREALTPFAAEAKFCDEQTRVQGMPSLDDDDGVDVNMGDLRRARAVLQEIEE